jgi:hypothetical protein
MSLSGQLNLWVLGSMLQAANLEFFATNPNPAQNNILTYRLAQ